MKISKLIIILIFGSIFGYLGYTIFPTEYSLFGAVTTDNAFVAVNYIDISTDEAGRLDRLNVEDFQAVKIGTIIAELDSAEVKLENIKLESLIELAEAGHKEAIHKFSLQNLTAEAIKSEISREEEILELEQKRLTRSNDLKQSGYTANNEVESLRKSVLSQQSLVENLRANLSSALARLELDRQAIETSKIRLQVAQNSLAMGQLSLERRNIRANLSGLIAQIYVNQGTWLERGDRILSMLDPSTAFVIANFKESDISDIQVGCPAIIRLDSAPGIELIGTVMTFAPTSEAEFSFFPRNAISGNFTKVIQRIPLKIDISDNKLSEPAILRPGASAIVKIDTDSC